MEDNLARALGELNEDLVYEKVNTFKEEGIDPLQIIAQLQAGMSIVGKRFERQEYFLSELVHSADIFRRAVTILEDLFQGIATAHYGVMVIGTVFEDIHDIGKNLVTSLMSCNGFKVYDLGVDVSPEKFIKAIQEYRPQFVGISCLLTSAFDNMKKTIEVIEQAGFRKTGIKILVGGGPVDESVRSYVGADFYCETAQDTVDLCKKLMGVSAGD
jgi:methanogenic corrinoid protein MtbC1